MSELPTYWVARVDHDDATELTGWRRSLFAVAEVAFADDAGPPPRERLRWTIARVAEFAADVGGKAVLAFRLALWAITWLAPLVAMSLPPLRKHSIERRTEILHRFERTPLGLSIFAVKAFLCMQYFEHPDVADEIGFDGEVK